MKKTQAAAKPVIDPKEIFGHNPDNYAHARIPHDKSFIRQILHDMRPSGLSAEPLRVIDIGAGTGKLGEQFLNLGCQVTFVEPNPNSAHYIDQHIGTRPGTLVINSTAEDTGLPDKYADVIAMGDAAHWMAPSTVPELRRMLKPEGKIVLFARFWSQDSDLTKEVHRLLLAHCPEYQTSTTQLLRDMPNYMRRQGRHLLNEEENFTRGYTIVKPYPKEELMDYFKSCSFSTPSIERDEAAFRKNVLDPLWEFAQDKGLMNDKGEMKVPYEINAMYGSPRLRINVDSGKGPRR